MKKSLLLLGIVLSLALVSCADDPFANNAGNVSAGNIAVTLDDNPSKGITIGSSQVTNARITLTGPTGIVQTATWNLGGGKTFTFNADITGNYTLGLRQVDTSNYVSTTNVTYSFASGYDYYITITLGGIVIVNIGTNATLPSSASSVVSSVASSVSSASSVVSSVASSVSSVASSSSSVTPPAGGSTFGIFSETVSNILVFDTDAMVEVWNGMSMSEDIVAHGDGTKSWKFIGTAAAGGWMGMGISVKPADNYRNMNAFASGSYRFMFKGTKGFKIGLKSGAGTEAWLLPAQMMPYGLLTNNTWCTVSIPVSAFAGLNMSQVSEYFMFVADTSTGYTTGSVYNFDNIYFTTNRTPVAGVSTFGLYTETYPVNVTWDTDGKIDIWNGFAMASDTNVFGDGTMSLKITAASSTWGGFGMRVEPLTTYKNLSAFVGGNLKFMYKSSKNFTKVGVKDGNGIEAWVTGAACVSSYGMRTDNTWSTVTIPMTALTGIDWTQIQQYFMFVADGANYTSGNVWNIDNIYFAK